MLKGRSKRRDSGQVAVETAITMPAFIFILLGMLQLGLMHQARVMTKYAAYRAVRVGSIHNAKKSAMTTAALASVLPYAGRETSMSFFKATPGDFSSSWGDAVDQNKGTDKIVTVTICEPFTTGGVNIRDDFDDPEGSLGAGGSWRDFNHGRLAVQVTFYHRMVIPFVNGLIWHIVKGDESTDMMRTLRLGGIIPKAPVASGRTIDSLNSLATRGIYIMPIRASWSMRMQSNFLSNGSDFTLPAENLCKVPWSH